MLLSWKTHLAAFALATVLTSITAFKLHSLQVVSLKETWATETEAAVEAAKAAVQGVCDANNKTTKEAAHALQVKLAATADRYYKLLAYNPSHPRPAAASSPAGRRDETARADVPFVQVPVVDGANAGRLNDDQAAALTILQDVVAEIYIANGQVELLPDEYRRDR